MSWFGNNVWRNPLINPVAGLTTVWSVTHARNAAVAQEKAQREQAQAQAQEYALGKPSSAPIETKATDSSTPPPPKSNTGFIIGGAVMFVGILATTVYFIAKRK